MISQKFIQYQNWNQSYMRLININKTEIRPRIINHEKRSQFWSTLYRTYVYREYNWWFCQAHYVFRRKWPTRKLLVENCCRYLNYFNYILCRITGERESRYAERKIENERDVGWEDSELKLTKDRTRELTKTERWDIREDEKGTRRKTKRSEAKSTQVQNKS